MLELLAVVLLGINIALAYLYWRKRIEVEQNAAVIAEINAKDGEISRLQTGLSQTQTTLEVTRSELTAVEQEAKAKESENTALRASIQQKQTEVETLQQHQVKVEELQQTLDTIKSAHDFKIALALTLANSAYDALLVIDRDCNVLAVNTAAEEIFNIHKPENKRLGDITNTPTLEMMVEDVLVNEEEILEEQMTIGDHIYLVRAQVIRRDGHMFIGLALQDITQLIRLNRARRDMVANISHELRTPIANIRLIIDGLFHDQDKPKRKDSISSLRAIARETDALLWLVQEMADLSMIESGQSIVRMVEVPLIEVVNEAIERLTNQMGAKQLKVVRHIPDKIHVLCDRDLMQRVVMNLLHNAMKWSPVGDAITINAVVDGEEVVVSVFDNGPGVPDSQVDRIFERFYQVDASRSGGEGTGLGLAICKHIVVAHGGRIWAEGNSKGAGGRFKFTLLLAEETPITPDYYASNSAMNGK